MAVKKAGAKGAKAPRTKAAAKKTTTKKPAKAVKASAARPAKAVAKRPAAKAAKRAAPRQAAASQEAGRYGCEVCGLMVSVDEWGEMNVVNLICCGEQMQPV
ncbi:MAG: hypothetical protein M0Z75_04140 [Nitrospiraceae bacterium]|nr:hypothetical protein [Nitrospiraceae bacterium]